jgi:hypothetical protein
MAAGVRIEGLMDRWRSRRLPRFTEPVSMVAAGSHVDDSDYQRWLPVLGQPHGRHRKVWEWCFILQTLDSRGLLRSGVSAVGFGVGTEPLVAVLAARGVTVLATDQPAEQAGAWDTSGQHAGAIDAVRRPDLCPDEVLDERVSFRAVDMRAIPADLGAFDVAWSSCCFEHLGSPDAGFDFVLASMDAVRGGGVAVHTTEIDCGSPAHVHEIGAVANGDYACFYRRRDLQRLVTRLRRAGYSVQCNYRIGAHHPLETNIDQQPYTHDPHMRLRVGDHVVTSFGLTIEKARTAG